MLFKYTLQQLCAILRSFTVFDEDDDEASGSDGFDADVSWIFFGGKLSEYVLCKLLLLLL